MTEEQLSALLRIKRFEQPPPQYFDRLLQDLHRRQRAELLHRSLWKIAIERVQTFFSEHSMGHLSYAGALASVLVVGVGAIGLITSGGAMPRTAAVNHFSVGKTVVATSAAPDNSRLLSLETNSRPVLGPSSLPSVQPGYQPVSQQRRYIIDALPASYEPSSTVNF